MFNNPFNSKVVSDITNFLNNHRNNVDILPCLGEKAAEAAKIVAEDTILEDRRNTLVSLFNKAVGDCGCRGTTKEANDFSKAVQLYLENKIETDEDVEIGKIDEKESSVLEAKQASTDQILDSLEKSYKQTGINSTVLGWKALGFSEPIRVGEVLEDFKAIFEPKDQNKAANDIKSWLNPKDHNEYKKWLIAR